MAGGSTCGTTSSPDIPLTSSNWWIIAPRPGSNQRIINKLVLTAVTGSREPTADTSRVQQGEGSRQLPGAA